MVVGLTSEQLVDKFLERSIYWENKLKGQLEALEHGESPELAKVVDALDNVPKIFSTKLVKMTPYIWAFADTITANNVEVFKAFSPDKS